MYNSLASAVLSAMAIATAVLASLPYPWAHIAATAVGSGVAAGHGIGVITSPKSSSKTGGNQQ